VESSFWFVMLFWLVYLGGLHCNREAGDFSFHMYWMCNSFGGICINSNVLSPSSISCAVLMNYICLAFQKKRKKMID